MNLDGLIGRRCDVCRFVWSWDGGPGERDGEMVEDDSPAWCGPFLGVTIVGSAAAFHSQDAWSFERVIGLYPNGDLVEFPLNAITLLDCHPQTPPAPAPRGEQARAGGSDGLQPDLGGLAEALYQEARQRVAVPGSAPEDVFRWLYSLPLKAPKSATAGIVRLFKQGWSGSEIAEVLCLFAEIASEGGE